MKMYVEMAMKHPSLSESVKRLRDVTDENMVVSPVESGTENDCAGEGY